MKKKDFIDKIGYLLLQFSKMLKHSVLSLTIIRKILQRTWNRYWEFNLY